MRNSQAASTRWYLPVQFLNPQDEREIGEVRIPYNLLSIQKLASWCMVRISRLLFCVVNDRKNETYYFAVRHPYEEISKFLSRIVRVAIISSVRVASVCYLPAAWNPIAFASSSATARKTKRENVSTALSHFKRTRSCVYDGKTVNLECWILFTLKYYIPAVILIVTNTERTWLRLNPTPLRRSFDDAKVKVQLRSYLGWQYEMLQKRVHNASVIAHRSVNWIRYRQEHWLEATSKKLCLFGVCVCVCVCMGKTKEQHPGFQRGPPP